VQVERMAEEEGAGKSRELKLSKAVDAASDLGRRDSANLNTLLKKPRKFGFF
jgi:hypothetical protein